MSLNATLKSGNKVKTLSRGTCNRRYRQTVSENRYGLQKVLITRQKK